MAHPKRRQSSSKQGKEDRTIMLKCLPWQFVPIAAPGIFIILYAANADITEENWQSKKR